jgi:hypothetical protein
MKVCVIDDESYRSSRLVVAASMHIYMHLSSWWSQVAYEPRKLYGAPHRLLLIFEAPLILRVYML